MAQKLRLHSPVGGEALVLKWPVATSEGKEGPEEIVDTIRLVCEDFPELSTPLTTRILKEGHDFANYGYDETKALCERYNKAIDSLRQLVKGSPRLKHFSKKASRNQLKHILQQCYNHSVKDPEKLNHYEPFSPEVYGETSFELVEQMIKSVKFSDSDYFIDLGSGVGQVILQVSAATDCNFCYGIEKAEWPAEYAVGMEREFRKWMKWYGKEHGDFLIEKGDFLDNEIKEKLNKATIVFVNNFAFGPKVDHELKQRFANSLKEGARIVSSKAFCPLNFRITERNLSDIGTIMQVEELSPLCGAVSWTGKPFAYYVHTIDRTLLEKYFQRLRNPNKKDDSEPRKDRKGRPVMSVKDKINGALSGGVSDSNALISSSRWRRARGLNENSRDSNSPLQLTSSAIKVLDFDSCSNSSQVSNSCSSVTGTAVGDAVVYGPTTRRQWNEYVKRPRSQSHSCTENEDSSNCDAGHENSERQFARLLQQKKKRMKTVKRLNNGVIGKRQLHQKKEDKKDMKESHSPPSKSKLRPRHSRRHVSSDIKPSKSGDTPVSVTASTTTTSTTTSSHQAKFSHAYTTVTSQPPSLDSLNLLHAHTVMSTSGKDSVDSVHYNDRRMTETSNAYFKPTVQKQTVSQLEKHAGFLDMIENMKQRYLSFLTFMQSPQYRAMLKLQIEQEKAKNAELKSKTEVLEKDISVLQKDGLGLIKDRLKEMGIKANTPSDLINQAKEIVMSHRALQAQAASLGAQINALQAEHNQKISQYKRGVHKKFSARSTKNGHIEVTQAKLSDQQCDQQKRLLIANVDRLHAELHELQNVNKSYTQQPAFAQQASEEITEPVEATNEKMTGAGADLKLSMFVDKSFILKEKLDMKENYDTFDEVLATLKQEISSISYKEQCNERIKYQRTPVSRMSTSLTTTSGFTSGFQSSSLQSSMAISESKQSITPQAKTLGQSTRFSPFSRSSKELSVSNAVAEGNPCQTSVASSLPAAAISSSWTTQPRSDSETAASSPRILPPGMKIDIKKPFKIGANTIKSPPVVINKTKVSSGKASVNAGLSLLHGLSNGSMQPNSKASIKGSSSIITSLSGKYTDNENTAAQNLISLKESLPFEVNSPTQNGPQQQQAHQIKTKQQQNTSKKKFNTLLINSLQPIPSCQNMTVFSKGDSEREALVLTKSQVFETPIASAGQTTPGLSAQLAASSTSNHHFHQGCLNSTAADLNKQLSSKNIIKGGSVTPATSKPRIVSSLRNSTNNSTSGIISSINNVNNVYHKHKPADHAISTDGCPSPLKFRLLEPKQEGKQFSALLTPTSHTPSSLLPLPQSSERDKTHSTVRQLLTTPALAKAQDSRSDLGVAGSISTNTDHIPYVTIQTPHHNIAANSHVINGSQASTFKLLQPQQQDLKSQQHVIISPKAASNVFINRLGMGSIANNGCNSSGSRGTLIPGLPSTIQGQTAVDSKGQAVKLIPSNGIDGKDWWIVVMQNNQADSTMTQHLQPAEPNVLGSHPQ